MRWTEDQKLECLEKLQEIECPKCGASSSKERIVYRQLLWAERYINGITEDDDLEIGGYGPQVVEEKAQITNIPDKLRASQHFHCCNCGQNWVPEDGGIELIIQGDYIEGALKCAKKRI